MKLVHLRWDCDYSSMPFNDSLNRTPFNLENMWVFAVHRKLRCNVLSILYTNSTMSLKIWPLGWGWGRWRVGISLSRCHVTSIGIPNLKIRRTCDRLIFNMGIHTWERRSLYWNGALMSVRHGFQQYWISARFLSSKSQNKRSPNEYVSICSPQKTTMQCLIHSIYKFNYVTKNMTLGVGVGEVEGGHLIIKMSCYQYRDPQVKDKTDLRPSYL